jgi:hypothetical protein
MRTISMERYDILPVEKSIEQYREAIVNLWRSNLADVPDDRFDWLYARNPCGPARTWLAVAKEKNEVVGIGSLYPRKMVIKGREHVVGVAVDFATDKNHRVLGPALKIQKAIIAGSRGHGFQFNYAYPTGNSVAVFRRVGYRPLGEIKEYFKPLTIEKKIVQYWRADVLAKVAGSIVDLYLRLRDRWRIVTLPRSDSAVEILERCDGRFDALWNAVKGSSPIAAEKSAAFLNWRYAINSIERYRFFCVFTGDRRRLQGYVAFTLRGDVAVVKDIFPVDDRKLFSGLLLRFIEEMRKEKVAYIKLSYFGNRQLVDRLRSVGFIERRTGLNFFVYWDAFCDPGIIWTIADPKSWSHFGGDLDLD